MSDTTTEPDREMDRGVDPDPADRSAEDPETPRRPSTGGAQASEKPSPESAEEGKDPEDISAAQVV